MKKVFLALLVLIIAMIITIMIIPNDFTGAKTFANAMMAHTKAENMVDEMTINEKICQMFVVRPEALDTSLTPNQVENTTEYGMLYMNKAAKDTLSQYPVGGIALFSKNIDTPDQLTNLISDMQSESNIPLFIGVDEEGGKVARVGNSTNFDVPSIPPMEEVGATNDTKNAKKVGTTIGTYLSNYGFNLDFAPDADINTNPDNIVIGNRAFGSSPRLVSSMVSAEIDGLHECNMMTSIKHFPGHGDTTGDTHNGYVSVDKDWNQLKSCELIPFIDSLNKTDMVMVSHITVPKVTDDGLPSSLSNEMIQGKLRDELGYNGVVITDSMEMGAITTEYLPSESAVKAIQAGDDIILMPQDFIEAYNGVYDAVQSGIIDESRIDQSVTRILELKIKYNLI